MLGEERFNYPPRHIEADNRLAWLLGRLERHYGDAPYYVHLRRNIPDTVQSFVNRYHSGIMRAYRGDGILKNLPEESDPHAVCLDYCDTVNTNIDSFLRGRSKKIEIQLETIDTDFIRFWEMIGAEGDLEAALAEFQIKHNRSRSRFSLLTRIRAKIERLVWRRLVRAK